MRLAKTIKTMVDAESNLDLNRSGSFLKSWDADHPPCIRLDEYVMTDITNLETFDGKTISNKRTTPGET